jgi:hypothetical protein
MSRFKFDEEGLLPPQEYPAALNELRESLLVQGPMPRESGWDSVWRLQLANNLEILAKQLWQAGVQTIYINGSFVENKGHPNDIDGYFKCDPDDYLSGRLEKRLNELDPKKVWTWDYKRRIQVANSDKSQLPMWVQYRVELFPDYGFNTSGILGPDRLPMPMSELFRFRRDDFKPKGIVRLIPTD